VNSYQKDLGDSDPMRRALGVRVLCAMVGAVEGLEGLVGVALERSARDVSWTVRRETAMGVEKVYR
jgi:vesicle coat complex subunit